jgi:hypothetical protein
VSAPERLVLNLWCNAAVIVVADVSVRWDDFIDGIKGSVNVDCVILRVCPTQINIFHFVRLAAYKNPIILINNLLGIVLVLCWPFLPMRNDDE